MKKRILKPPMMMALALTLVMTLSTGALAASPLSIDKQNLNGSEYIVKTFELAPDSDPAALIEDDFEQDGFLYTHYTTAEEQITATDTKIISETSTVESESKSLEAVLKKFPATFPYEQDGYIGNLVLDTGSISTEVAGYTTKTSTVSTTQTYPALMYQDPSMIPQTAVKNGVTLPLAGVSWTVTGTSLAGDSLVPTEFTATATYSKKVSTSVATGYVSTATYTGEVSREEVKSVRYTLTYLGTPIPEPEPEAAPIPWGVILTGLAVLLAGFGGAAIFLHFRSRQGVQVFNLIGEDYLCVGQQRLDLKQPIIDLNEFEDVIQSTFFSFVLDKSSTRKLFGRNITVTLGDITMTHRVKDMDGKYRFNLELGVEL